jgi:hypothetical protein
MNDVQSASETGGSRVLGMTVGECGGTSMLGRLRLGSLHISLGKGHGGVFVEL